MGAEVYDLKRSSTTTKGPKTTNTSKTVKTDVTKDDVITKVEKEDIETDVEKDPTNTTKVQRTLFNYERPDGTIDPVAKAAYDEGNARARKELADRYEIDENGRYKGTPGSLLGFDPEVYRKEQEAKARLERFKQKEAGWRNALGVITDIATGAAGGNVWVREPDNVAAKAADEADKANDNINRMGTALAQAKAGREQAWLKAEKERMDKYIKDNTYKAELTNQEGGGTHSTTRGGGSVTEQTGGGTHTTVRENGKTTESAQTTTTNGNYQQAVRTGNGGGGGGNRAALYNQPMQFENASGGVSLTKPLTKTQVDLFCNGIEKMFYDSDKTNQDAMIKAGYVTAETDKDGNPKSYEFNYKLIMQGGGRQNIPTVLQGRINDIIDKADIRLENGSKFRFETADSGWGGEEEEDVDF